MPERTDPQDVEARLREIEATITHATFFPGIHASETAIQQVRSLTSDLQAQVRAAEEQEARDKNTIAVQCDRYLGMFTKAKKLEADLAAARAVVAETGRMIDLDLEFAAYISGGPGALEFHAALKVTPEFANRYGAMIIQREIVRDALDAYRTRTEQDRG